MKKILLLFSCFFVSQENFCHLDRATILFGGACLGSSLATAGIAIWYCKKERQDFKKYLDSLETEKKLRREAKTQQLGARNEDECSVKSSIACLNNKVDGLVKDINEHIVGNESALCHFLNEHASSLYSHIEIFKQELLQAQDQLRKKHLEWLNQSDALFIRKLQEFQSKIYDDSKITRDFLKGFMDNVNKDLTIFTKGLEDCKTSINEHIELFIDVNNRRLLASETRLEKTIINELTIQIKNAKNDRDQKIVDIAHSVSQINSIQRDFFDTIIRYIVDANKVILNTIKDDSNDIKTFIVNCFNNQEARNFNNLDTTFNASREQLDSMQKSFSEQLSMNEQSMKEYFTAENKKRYDVLVEKIETVSQRIQSFEENTTSSLDMLLGNTSHVLEHLQALKTLVYDQCNRLQTGLIKNNQLLEYNTKGIIFGSYQMTKIQDAIFNLNIKLISLFKKAFPDINFFPTPSSIENNLTYLAIEAASSPAEKTNACVSFEKKESKKSDLDVYKLFQQMQNRFNSMLLNNIHNRIMSFSSQEYNLLSIEN